jgi:hypothetical protein
MKRAQLVLAVILSLCFVVERSHPQTENQRDSTAITAMLRFDDIGMCHGLNSAIGEVAATGMPMSVSVMFACPWYQESVPILKQFPNVSVGVHLVLNSEWKNYRWGPVTGAGSVPSLVDSDGYFFPSRVALFAHNPRVEEVEKELRAQIDRAVRSGLRIDYLDYHMGAAVQTPELRSLVEKLANEYHLGISRYFGERDAGGVYNAPIERKTDTLMHITNSLTPGVRWLFVFHIGLETPEMDALVDMNSFGLSNVSKYRNAERKAVLSERFQNAIRLRKIQLRSYYDVIKETGLENMRRPEQ